MTFVQNVTLDLSRLPEYTPEIQRSIKSLAESMSLKTGRMVDASEFQSIGEYAVAKHLSRYDPARGASLKSWLYGKARWAMQDYMREVDPNSRNDRKAGIIKYHVVSIEDLRRDDDPHAADPLETLDSGVASPVFTLEQTELGSLALSTLGELDETSQQIIKLRILGGAGYREVSAAVGLSIVKIKLIEVAALASLRKCLEGINARVPVALEEAPKVLVETWVFEPLVELPIG